MMIIFNPLTGTLLLPEVATKVMTRYTPTSGKGLQDT